MVAAGTTYIQLTGERERLFDDLGRRASMLAASVDVAVDPAQYAADPRTANNFVRQFSRDERLSGFAICDLAGSILAGSPGLAVEFPRLLPLAQEAARDDKAVGRVSVIGDQERYVFAVPLHSEAGVVTGAILILQDTAQIHARLSEIWLHNFVRLLAQVFLLSLVSLYIVRWNILTPVDQIADWMRRVRSGQHSENFSVPPGDMFAPLAKEATTLAHHFLAARLAAEEQAKVSEEADAFWTPERLKEHVRSKLGGKSLFVVSNREPYMHVQSGKKLETIVPAAGLVTALDPVLRACGGTWIAHGSGDGDWRVVDKDDRIRVPEDDPRYVLRRVLLSKDEEEGYYYGFSNEGLWPLCLMTHQRPVFRESDWRHYEAVNRKFAEVTLKELEGTDEPCVLIQDYQFALLPRMIKQERPDARVAIFWHIPWPNSEAFSICPWPREVLNGLLGADLVGFHTQLFCNNFLETVDRSLESRIRWDTFSVEKEGHQTSVKPFPVSVGFPQVFPDVPFTDANARTKAELLRDLGIRAGRLGIGVERIDYTKGLLERFLSIERFFEKHPQYVGEFTFGELGAPSRTHIKAYHDFIAQVEAEADRINWKFKRKDWKPIALLLRHHSHREILPYYQTADVCMVTSLHDGMNLVAKEFVAARSEDSGVLILSRFAGAAGELRDALIVNPYDIERMADAIYAALEMPKDEQVLRMRRMRQNVREHNIYRWAGNLVGELARLRLDRTPAEERK